MSDPVPPMREEIVAALDRIGVVGVDDTFIKRCIELNCLTRRTLSLQPSTPDKGLEPSHVFSPPMTTQK